MEVILVLLIGGRDYINPKRRQGLYLVVLSGKKNCQLGDYILPTTFYKNLKNPLTICTLQAFLVPNCY